MDDARPARGSKPVLPFISDEEVAAALIDLKHMGKALPRLQEHLARASGAQRADIFESVMIQFETDLFHLMWHFRSLAKMLYEDPGHVVGGLVVCPHCGKDLSD